MIFYLIDKILDLQPGRRIVARKEVVPSDLLMNGHPQAGPHLAYPLIVESLAQAGGYLIFVTSNFRQRTVLGSLHTITPGRPAEVGDHLELVAEVESQSDEAVLFQLRATCRGEEVTRVDGALLFLVTAADFDDPAVGIARYQRLCRAQSFAEAHVDEDALPDWTPYDTLGEVVPGERATAEKVVRTPSPLLDIHFPLFPVVPGVLVTQSLISLSQELLARERPPEGWRVGMIQAAKFQKYIRPHERMLLETRVLRASDEEVQFAASASVEGQQAMVLRRLTLTRR